MNEEEPKATVAAHDAPTGAPGTPRVGSSSLAVSYRDRRRVKRDYRKLWITRITAACKMRGTRYSLLMNGLRQAGIVLNRKMLSQIAIEDPKLFDTICAAGVKASKATPAKKG